MRYCSYKDHEVPLDQFRVKAPNSKGQVFYQPYCRECTSTYQRDRRAEKKANGTYKPQTRTEADKERDRKTARRTNLRKYGITESDYEDQLQVQQGRCAICRTNTPWTRSSVWHVDHCHSSGAFRGLLCSNCNTGLGQFKDNIEFLKAAIEYLENPPRKQQNSESI